MTICPFRRTQMILDDVGRSTMKLGCRYYLVFRQCMPWNQGGNVGDRVRLMACKQTAKAKSFEMAISSLLYVSCCIHTVWCSPAVFSTHSLVSFNTHVDFSGRHCPSRHKQRAVVGDELEVPNRAPEGIEVEE